MPPDQEYQFVICKAVPEKENETDLVARTRGWVSTRLGVSFLNRSEERHVLPAQVFPQVHGGKQGHG